jgi:ATP-binding cassette, subfamily B, bacterial
MPSNGAVFRVVRAQRLIATLIRRHRKPFIVAVAGAAVYATCTVLSSMAIRRVVDDVLKPRFEDGSVANATLLGSLFLVVIIGLVRAAGVVVRRSFAGIAEWRAAGSFAGDVVQRISSQPVTWLSRKSTGDVVARLSTDTEAAVSVLAPLPFASSVVVMLAVAAVLMILTDLVMGLIALVLLPLVLLLNLLYQARVDHHYQDAQLELGNLSSAVHESFDGVTVVKAFGAEERESIRLSRVAGRLRNARIELVRLRATFETILDALPSLGIIVLLLVGALRIEAAKLSVGELTSFVYLFTLIAFPLRLIGYALSELPHSQAGLDRVEELLSEPLEDQPNIAVASSGVAIALGGVTVGGILVGVNLAVAPGERVAVVGPTGSGKSTLVRVLCGTLAVDDGTVEIIDGGVAVVFQEPFLFAQTIRHNLTMGRPLSDEQIWSALELSKADSFVRDLPGGLETVVGERGVGLSGGQRQRLALARAVMAGRPILLLDDTTSALDPTTEADIVGALMDFSPHTTFVIVASRPSTIALAERVVFLVDGKVADTGGHVELMARNAAYRGMIEAFEVDREV